MEFVLIPAGEFMMGSPDSESGRSSHEGPVHKVRITRPFYVGKYEVTQAAYEAVVGKNPSHFKGSSNPVERVSWHDSVAFCKKLSQPAGVDIVLPTEAQWEYACRAGTRTRFSFGDDLNYRQLGEYAWYSSNSGNKTHAVGEKKPNPWGLYDMHGDVWEWCEDWYGSYSSGSATDPTGPSRGTNRVLRGGSWYSSVNCLRSANRNRNSPDITNYNYGFRCVAVGGVLRGH